MSILRFDFYSINSNTFQPLKHRTIISIMHSISPPYWVHARVLVCGKMHGPSQWLTATREHFVKVILHERYKKILCVMVIFDINMRSRIDLHKRFDYIYYITFFFRMGNLSDIIMYKEQYRVAWRMRYWFRWWGKQIEEKLLIDKWLIGEWFYGKCTGFKERVVGN